MQVFPKNHICNKAINEIVEIQRPLNKLKGLHMLYYGRYYPEEKKGFIFYTNMPYWMIRTTLHVPFQTTYVKDGIYPWSECYPDNFISIAEDFNIYNPINFISTLPDGSKESFTFAFDTQKHPGFTFYLNNIDLLKCFMEYFKGMAESLINKAEKTRVKIPSQFLGQELPDDNTQEILASLLACFALPRNVQSDNALAKLTEREFLCLCYYLTGKTAAEISKILKIAPKTASAHLYNVRAKLGARSRSQLFQTAFEHGLIKTHGIDIINKSL